MASCPRCEDELEVRQATAPGQTESIDVDCCLRCGGVWIDGAELSRASPQLGELFGKRREYVISSRPSGLCCPRCEGALSEVGVNDVPVDWCRVCFGVWLDGGEYQAITAAPPRSVHPSTVACFACRCQVSVGDTYYSDRGLVCSGCRDAELEGLARREVIYQEAEAERRSEERSQRDEQAKQLLGVTSSELAALRRQLRSGSLG